MEDYRYDFFRYDIAREVKSKLMTTLVHLLETSPLDKITVTELTKTANVARSTYYRYYASKEEIITEYLDMQAGLVTAAVMKITKNKHLPWSKGEIWVRFARQLYTNRELLHVLIRQDLKRIVYPHVQAQVLFFYKNGIISTVRSTWVSTVDVMTAGIVEIIVEWDQDGFTDKTKDMAGSISSIFKLA